MKEPERLVGFVSYDEKEIAFEFDSETFVLKLYPEKELWKKYVRPSYVFDKNKINFTEHEWIPENRISGHTSSRYKVIFSVQGEPSSYSGFLSFSVNWYFCCYDSMDENNISGFSIEGVEVDSFYSPWVALEQKNEYDEVNNISKTIVSSNQNEVSSCGSYLLDEEIKASIEVEAYSVVGLGNYEHPIFANSRFVTNFSKKVDLDILVKAYQNVLRFFMFVTYRSNLSIRKANLYVNNENGGRDYVGLLVLPQEEHPETEKKSKRHLIVYNDLKEKASLIFDAISMEKITFQHVCSDYDSRSSYPISRVIMILAAFERVYDSIYGKDSERSEEYIETKAEIVQIIEEYENKCTGKRKKYVKQLKDYVYNRDSSFAFNVLYAIKRCSDIMMPFIKKRYKGQYSEELEGISERVGAVRNGVAHCKLDFELEAIHLVDIHVMEELLYAMELKNIGLSTYECHKAIGRLFHENIYFKENDVPIN